MRWTIVALVAISLLLAGCSGQPVDSTPSTQSATPTPSPSVPTATDTPVTDTEPETLDLALPPGLSRTGLTNRSALLNAHRDALSNTDYEATARVNMPDRREGRDDRVHVQVDVDEQRVRWTSRFNPAEYSGEFVDVTVYGTDKKQYYQINNYYHRYYEWAEHDEFFNFNVQTTGGLEHPLNKTLAAGELQYVETHTERNWSYYRFDIHLPDQQNSTGEVLIREDGLITAVETGDHQVTPGITSYSLQTGQEVTVESAPWKQKALDRELESLRTPPEQPASSGGSGECGSTCQDFAYGVIDFIF